MAFFNNMFSRPNSNQMMQMPAAAILNGLGEGGFGGGMFGFGGSRQPVQQQAPIPAAMPVAHSYTPVGQHPTGPQGSVPMGPQGLHPMGPQGEQLVQQRQAEIVAAQQAQANQPTLASMLRNSTFRGGFGRFGGGGSE